MLEIRKKRENSGGGEQEVQSRQNDNNGPSTENQRDLEKLKEQTLSKNGGKKKEKCQ